MENRAERGKLVLALATDGDDGATRTAGALVDGGRLGGDPPRRHRSGGGARPPRLPAALTAVPDALLRTGTTGTNVGDLAIYLRG